MQIMTSYIAVLIVTAAVAIVGGYAIRQVECTILNHYEGGGSCPAEWWTP